MASYGRDKNINLCKINMRVEVFKGMRVAIREHPYIASVRRDLAHYCMATMLTKNVFVTVAHPLIDIPIFEFTVVVGENYSDRGSGLLTVTLIIIHELFDRYTLANDVALIRVYEDTAYRCSVKSIQLVHPRIPLYDARAFVTGWGRCDRTGRELCLPRSTKFTPGEKLDPMLRSVSFIMKDPNPYCEGYRQNGVNLLPGMLCLGQAREENKMAPCLAAPGAPLVVEAHLAGVLSWGYGCGYDNDLPLIYTNMQYHQPWFLHNIPILRHITHDNLSILFEAKRAYVMSMWLIMTRIHPPPPLVVQDKPLEMLKLDRELAKIRGNVYDLRDFIFNGIHHLYKVRLYQILRQRIRERLVLEKLRDKLHRPTPQPFLNVSVEKEHVIAKDSDKFKPVEAVKILSEPEKTETDSENSYGD
ncbi:unnamed protein product [Chrysodeixis includens]|uniref:Peptidase S1 domain-containing protein n=1 Tax=Chrysodeixis includens TaxID=689277 RepID=A0A9N8PY60_CHRIL|nr:unnamed protein product [Chrysodeixis includens]